MGYEKRRMRKGKAKDTGKERGKEISYSEA
jgi:hypothetical protein